MPTTPKICRLAGSLAGMEVPEIDVTELAARQADGISLIDVRRPEEFEVARVPGAQLIPLADLVERIDEVPTDATVYVICATGARSARAVSHFRSQGIDAVNVAGGTVAWVDAGLPTDGAGSEAASG
jgi:rhodanese-related sulfurtransferase